MSAVPFAHNALKAWYPEPPGFPGAKKMTMARKLKKKKMLLPKLTFFAKRKQNQYEGVFN